jgi:uncharacterized membrane protein YcfT
VSFLGMTQISSAGGGRTDWVDAGKALCIILVVMMHSTLGLQAAVGRTGFMDAIVAFFTPFRIPAFFVFSGLFLAKALQRDLMSFLRGRIAHLAYFYLLWVSIHVLTKNAGAILDQPDILPRQLLWSVIEPFGTLWFIHLLAVFSLVTYFLRGANPLLLLAAAAMLEMLPIETGSTLIDEFAARYVYFVGGWALAPFILRTARHAADHAIAAIGLILLFGLVNGAAVFAGVSGVPIIGLLLGSSGAIALAAAAALVSLAPAIGPFLRFIGSRTLTIYVAFFIPMVAARLLMVKLGVGDLGSIGIGLASIAVTSAAVAGPLLMERVLRATPARLLFEKPAFSPAAAADERLRVRMDASLRRSGA